MGPFWVQLQKKLPLTILYNLSLIFSQKITRTDGGGDEQILFLVLMTFLSCVVQLLNYPPEFLRLNGLILNLF